MSSVCSRAKIRNSNMARIVAESEILFEQVKSAFWRKEEADFAVRFSEAEMKDWEIIPTHSVDEMILVRCRLDDAGSGFAGFIHHEGRYCFYFKDQNIIKIQYLDNCEIDCFSVHSFSEFNLELVARELKALQEDIQGS